MVKSRMGRYIFLPDTNDFQLLIYEIVIQQHIIC